MAFDSHVEIPVFDNPDRTSADVYQLISDETIQIGKFLYIPQVSFVDGKAVHSFKDIVLYIFRRCRIYQISIEICLFYSSLEGSW